MNSNARNGLWMAGTVAVAMGAVWVARDLFGAYVIERTLSAAEVLALGQLVVLAFGLGSVVLLWAQSRDEAKWRRLLSYHQYFSDCPASQARTDMLEVMTRLGHLDHLENKGTPLHGEDVTSICANRSDRQKIVVYLDGFEQMAGAINSGIVDEDYAYQQEAGRVLRIYHISSHWLNTSEFTIPRLMNSLSV